ncbi:hypothetical protein [Actinomycetospora termitidis]|uniref:Uncharacterized protein n=1 Tax=Actinomycetospora termitidis TaxID=3053470 RepID=A0ABT7MFZ2_9PSEU|nr:hypothetical protein [Actinomycetospora sp. Odt1-22]MDL5159591.1 hypothetical protein [Actinomycetospora sp. Odt1-22]
MTQLDRTTPDVVKIPVPRSPLEPWTPTPPSGIRWMDAAPAPAEPAPASPRHSRRAWWIAGAMIVLLAVIALVAALVARANRTMTVQGSVVVVSSGAQLPGAPCLSSPVSGRSVSMWDAGGRLVAAAPLGSLGYAVDQWGSSTPFADGCRFDVLFTDVPANDRMYRVGVGSSVANTVPFSRDQLTTTGASITYGR